MTPYQIKDSGNRQTFATGAQRDTQDDKPQFGLLPVYAIGRISKLFAKGRTKYKPEQKPEERIPVENWRRGMDTARTMESLLRHAMQYLEGDRSEDHMAAVGFNTLVLIETEEMIRRGILPESLNTLPDWTRPGGNLIDTPASPPPAPAAGRDFNYSFDEITARAFLEMEDACFSEGQGCKSDETQVRADAILDRIYITYPQLADEFAHLFPSRQL